jgi:hypothetical protein
MQDWHVCYFHDVPVGSYYSFSFEFTAGGVHYPGTSRTIAGIQSWGYPDVFGLGVTAGGHTKDWDFDAAWAAKGLPASGQLPITLTVTRVAHCH